MSGYLIIEHASLTDVGVRRPHNQDNYAALPAGDVGQWRQRGHLFVVADGMGAHAVGELASKMAVDNIPHTYYKHARGGTRAALLKAITETNAVIHARGLQNPEFARMGTTGSVLVLGSEGAWVGHVGDSRVYRVRGSMIEQLSFDHSLVWELAKRKGIQPDQMQGIPSNVIVRSLGPEPTVEIDIEGPHPIEVGDLYVICSDGLSGPVNDRKIGAVVSALAPADACRFLVDLANLQGGPDNITVVVVRVLAVKDKELADNHKSMKWTFRPNWRVRIPWPLPALLLGIVLALAAIGLTFGKLPGAIAVFVLAAAAIASGLIGLLWQNRHDAGAAAEPNPPGPPRVYRSSPCAIELPLLKELAQTEAVLEERIRGRHWQANWDDCKKHHDMAEHLMHAGALPDAFREFCLAMRPLSEALQRERHKEESFQPVWDKAAE